MSRRRLRRLERADKVCREVRWAIASPHNDWSRVVDLLFSWMRVAGKDKFVRP